MSMFVEVKRHLNTTPEKLFAAWSNPEQLTKWFGVKVEANPVVGGAIRIHFDPNGGVHGNFVAIEPHTYIAFTWNAAGGDTTPDTTVHVRFTKNGSGTDLTLRHEGFVDQKLFESHDEGWLVYMELWNLRNNLVPQDKLVASSAATFQSLPNVEELCSQWLNVPVSKFNVSQDNDGAKRLQGDQFIALWKPCDHGTSLAVGQWGFSDESARAAARELWVKRLDSLSPNP